MPFSDLPTEVLYIIARNVHCCKDVRSLCLSNRRLYSLLKKTVPRDTQTCHLSRLGCAAATRNHELMQDLLNEMDADESDSSEKVNLDKLDQIERRDLRRHPLFRAHYTINAIIHIQEALIAAVKAESSKLVTLLLERGATARFRAWRADFPGYKKTEEQKFVDRYIMEVHFQFQGVYVYPPVPPRPYPLDLAIEIGNREIFNLLLDKGKAWNCGEQCPTLAAVKQNNQYMVERLMKRGTCPGLEYALAEAIERKDRDMMDLLLTNGVDLARHGYQSIFVAISQGDKEMVEFLIHGGADPNVLSRVDGLPDDDGGDFVFRSWSTIYTALFFDQIEICKFLVNVGVHPEKEDLELARDKENEEAIALLEGFSYTDVRMKEAPLERAVRIRDEDDGGMRSALGNVEDSE